MTDDEVDPGMERATTSVVYEYLKEHGPSTSDELPHQPKYTDRRRGLVSFRLTGAGTGGSTTSGIGSNQYSVYYILDMHAVDDVVEKWMETNPQSVENTPAHALWAKTRRRGKEWGDAIRELLDEDPCSDMGGDTGGERGGTCPLCGEEYSDVLPNHLPCDN